MTCRKEISLYHEDGTRHGIHRREEQNMPGVSDCVFPLRRYGVADLRSSDN
jgi:hypothetical protein